MCYLCIANEKVVCAVCKRYLRITMGGCKCQELKSSNTRKAGELKYWYTARKNAIVDVDLFLDGRYHRLDFLIAWAEICLGFGFREQVVGALLVVYVNHLVRFDVDKDLSKNSDMSPMWEILRKEVLASGLVPRPPWLRFIISFLFDVVWTPPAVEVASPDDENFQPPLALRELIRELVYSFESGTLKIKCLEPHIVINVTMKRVLNGRCSRSTGIDEVNYQIDDSRDSCDSASLNRHCMQTL